jgi:GNAT superfamily N-acetyltransferase
VALSELCEAKEDQVVMLDYHIDYLGNKPQFLDELAELWTKEWVPNPTEEDIQKKIIKFGGRLSTEKPPFILVAYKDDILLGSAGLTDYDLEKCQDLSPWLFGVLVKPEYRGQGIATELISKVKQKSSALGYDQIYLHTEFAQGLYEKLDCCHLEHTTNDYGQETDIYTLET